MPLLSICIPTYNRALYLSNTLSQLTKEEAFLNSDDIEIIISDNASEDETEEVALSFKRKFGNKIIYYRQEKNIRDRNFAFCLSLSTAKYAKLNNDNLFFKKGELTRFVELLRENGDLNVIVLTNRGNGEKPQIYMTFDELLFSVTYLITWIGGLCVRVESFNNLQNPDRYADTNFSQVDIISRLMDTGKALVYPNQIFDMVNLKNKGGYSIPEVFGFNYINLINKIFISGKISKKTYNYHNKMLLLKHINKYCFNQDDTQFSRKGYFKYLFPIFRSKYYFYTGLIDQLLKFIGKKIYSKSIDKHSKRKIIRILLFKLHLRKVKNNTLAHVNGDSDKVEIGQYTYGTINAITNENRSEKLIIGNFCSIGPNVQFIVSSEHRYKTVSSYPFRVRVLGYNAEAESKGDIVIKDDVWIGYGAIICSGVTINQGAIVAAGSVVTKDVPPYAIVGGNPAKIIKFRFSDEIINKLVKINFANLDNKKILELNDLLYKEVNESNIDFLLGKLQ